MAAEMAIAAPIPAEETAAEETDDQSSVKSDESGSNRVKFLCSYGGKILPRPVDGKLRYAGGEIRVVAVRRSIAFSDLIARLEKVFGSNLSLKLQLPTEDLDALVSITSDDDLENMLEEYERMEAKEGSAKVRAFLFPAKPQTAPAAGETVAVGKRGNNINNINISLEQRFVDAVNGAPPRPRPGGSPDPSDAGGRPAVPFEPRGHMEAHGGKRFVLDAPGALRELDWNKRRIHPTGREQLSDGANFPVPCRSEVSGSTPPRNNTRQDRRTAGSPRVHEVEHGHPRYGGFQFHPHDGRHVDVQPVSGAPQFGSRYVQSTTAPHAPLAGNKLAAYQPAPRVVVPSQQAGSTRVISHCDGGFPAATCRLPVCSVAPQHKSPFRYAIRTATQIHHDRVVRPAQQSLARVIADDPRMRAQLVCVDHASSAYVAYGGPPPVQVRFPGRPRMVPSSSGWPFSDSSRGGICQGHAS